MGKIRLKVVGDEQQEQEQKQKAKARKEGKRANVRGVGLGGGQRITTVGISEEEIAKELEGKVPVVSEVSKVSEAEQKTEEKKSKKGKKAKARVRSKRHNENSSLIARKTSYPIHDGLEMLRKFKKSNF